MDIHVIEECTLRGFEGKIEFPEVVKKLSQTGTERYIVDLIGKQKWSYGTKGEIHQGSLSFEEREIPYAFDAQKVQKAILESQQKQIDYKTFLQRLMEAGCCYYEAFISGQKVIYFGRDGNFHIETFAF